MPNWCNNTLELQHTDPTMIARAKQAFAEGRLLDEFVPVPKSLMITAGREGSDGDPKQMALEEAEALNRKEHGYANWYDYCVAEWGTKWDVGGDEAIDHTMEDENGTRLSLSFDSAWAPPCAAMAKLVDLGFDVKLFYYEPGMCFAGIWHNGDDDFYELNDMTSVEVEDELPAELDEMFGISENMAEWEAENEEEEEADNE